VITTKLARDLTAWVKWSGRKFVGFVCVEMMCYLVTSLTILLMKNLLCLKYGIV
jgi:hypothetical protein